MYGPEDVKDGSDCANIIGAATMTCHGDAEAANPSLDSVSTASFLGLQDRLPRRGEFGGEDRVRRHVGPGRQQVSKGDHDDDHRKDSQRVLDAVQPDILISVSRVSPTNGFQAMALGGPR